MKEQRTSDLVYGRHAVQNSMESDAERVEKVWIQKGLRFSDNITRLVKRVKTSGAVVQYVDKKVLDRLTRRSNHQGIVLRQAAVAPVDLGVWLQSAGSAAESLVLALDGVQDPGNFGAIFRSAAAAGAGAVVFPKRGSAPLGATAMKTSAGTLNSVPAIRVSNLRNALDILRKNGFFIIGISEKADQSIVDMNPPSRTVILAGSEDRGIRPIHQACCDEIRSIPMSGPAGSLNVSVAVAIVLYEIVRHA